MKQAAQARPWQAALGMFTVIPVPAGAMSAGTANRAVRWLPAVGAVLAAPAAAALLMVEAGGTSGPRRLLAAVVTVGLLALLTGGLHLDGLADTADGLGSRRPPAEALAIMRRGDTGPLGVASLLLVVLLQVSSLAALRPGLSSAAAVLLASVTARVAALLATGPAFPPARPGGFGALVAGATPAPVRMAAVSVLLVFAAGAGVAAGGVRLAVSVLAAAVTGLLAGALVARVARTRLGGMTGDVFGAVIEVAAAATLLTLALLG